MATTTPPPSTAAPGSRERILAAAQELFYREGVRATGVDRVVEAAGVSKLTFYRQFESKDALVLAFLERRHERWMAWFADALARHGGRAEALVPALAEWFGSADFRGCAFLNSVGELGPALPAVVEAARRHKQGMTQALAALLPPGRGRAAQARALALAVDGAIVQAQYLPAPARALAPLREVVGALAGQARVGP